MLDDNFEPPEREDCSGDYAEWEQQSEQPTITPGSDKAPLSDEIDDELRALLEQSYQSAVNMAGEKMRQRAPSHSFKSPTIAKEETQFNFRSFSLRGESQKMKSELITQVDVFERLAVMGQMTVLYAKPNTGKTLLSLWLLIEAIKSGRINAENVFYINADDGANALVEKLEIAERFGFHMMAPSRNGFKSADFSQYMNEVTKQGEAKGMVVVLDTLKKFTDLMDKKRASDFGAHGRAFVQHGGTLIMLAHTNKNRDMSGKVVFGGTSDIVDDVDCAYTLDIVGSSNDRKTVVFENFKNRGAVDKEATFSYSEANQHYDVLLNSVERLGNDASEKIRRTQAVEQLLNQNGDAIESIREAIQEGVTNKTDLVSHVSKSTGLSKSKIHRILKTHTGYSEEQGHRWIETKGIKAAKIYRLLNGTMSSPEDYERNSMGE